MKSLTAFVLLITISAAQVSPCPVYESVAGWDDTIVATPLGGGTGPEDVAWSAASGTIFVSHDILGSSMELLIEYDLDGNMIQANATLPGAGGLCDIPGSPNLLTTAGSSIIEVAPNGMAVPGGININLSGYGNIQDLDFDGVGTLWVHNGNSGDFSTVDLVTGVATNQFTLPFGTQGFTISPFGSFLMATAFFNTGTYPAGTFLEVDSVGSVMCQGQVSSNFLSNNGDPCAGGGTYTVVNGMAWIDSLGELAISNFFAVDGRNVTRFAPVNSAAAIPYGTAATRSDGMTFGLSSYGDPVVGTSGFGLSISPVYPGDSLIWGVSAASDCTGMAFGTNGSQLLIDIGPGLLFSLVLPSPFTSLTIPLDLTFAAPSLAGVEVFTQVAGHDFFSPANPILLTNGLRVRFY